MKNQRQTSFVATEFTESASVFQCTAEERIEPHIFSTQGPVQVSVYQYVRILPVQGTVGPYGSNAIVKGIAAVRKIDFSFFCSDVVNNIVTLDNVWEINLLHG